MYDSSAKFERGQPHLGGIRPIKVKGNERMQILERREGWIHSHFVTDCIRLSAEQGREIVTGIAPVLRFHHIVYGIHFHESKHEPGLRIVLECIPLRPVLDEIETALKQLVAPIPARPILPVAASSQPGMVTPAGGLVRQTVHEQ
jgi:hypothetical protein